MATKEQLLNRAIQVRNETEDSQNSASRVGQLLYDIIDYIKNGEGSGGYVDLSNYYNKSQVDNKLGAKQDTLKGSTADAGQNLKAIKIGSSTINLLGKGVVEIPTGGEGGDTIIQGLDEDTADSKYLRKDAASGNQTVLAGDVTFAHDVTVSGSLTAGGVSTGTGGVTVTGGNVSVNKSGNNGGNITAAGTITGGALSTSGTISGGSLSTLGNAGIGGTLNAGATTVSSLTDTGSATVGGTLEVTGSTTLNGATTVDDTLHVTGAADFDSTVNVDGKLTGGNAEFNNVEVKNTLIAKDITAETLTVTKAAHFFELVIDELKSLKGAVMITRGNCKADIVENVGSGSTITGWKVYYRADDGSSGGRQIHQSFMVGDQAICQAFGNIHAGTVQNVSTTYYWRLVTEVSSNPVTKDGNLYHYIVLSNNSGEYDAGSGTPAVGDNIVQLGYRTSNSTLSDEDKARQSAIILSAYTTPDTALKPASIAFYRGINNFNLASHRNTYIDASGAYFKGSFVTESGTVIDGSGGGDVSLDIYTLVANTPVVVKDSNNNFSPSTITIKFLHTTNEGSTLINTIPTGCTLKLNGNTINSPSVEPNVDANSYHFVLYNSNNAAVAETTVNVFSADVTNGSDGSTTEFVYKQLAINATTPDLPTVSGAWSDNASGANGWSSNVPVYQVNTKIWLALRTISYTGSTPSYGSWQGPIALTGEVGADGANYEFIYGRFQTAQTWGNTVDNPAHWEASQTDDYTGPGSLWTDNPTGVNETYQYEYVSIRKKEGGVWGQFSTPALWSKWGEKGNDGDGVKYIFARFNRKVTPSSPTFRTGCPDVFSNGTYGVQYDSSEGKYYISDTSDNRWYDDVISPQKNGNTYYDVYCSISKSSITAGSTKSWNNFGKPALWSRYVEGGELYKLVGLKEVFEVQITSYDNYDTIVGAIACNLKYLVAHVVGDTVTYLDDSYLEAYQLHIELDNTSGENSFDLLGDEPEAAGWDQNLEAGYFYFTYANLLSAIRPGASGNAINYYSLVKGNSASQAYLPTKMTVTLIRDGKVLDARTVNLIFKPSHIFSVTEAALNSVYQGLNGDTTTGYYTSGFSQIHQDWERINLSASNVQKLNSGEFPENNEYQQYAFYLNDGSSAPNAPTGDVTEEDTVSAEWTLGHPTPRENRYPYLFYSYRTRMYQSDTWGSWSTPVLFWEYGKDKELKIINSAALEVRADSIQSTVQQNVLNTVNGRGYQNETQVRQTANDIVSTATSTLTNQISTIKQESDSISLSVESLQAAGNLLTDSLFINSISKTSSPWSYNVVPQYTAETAGNEDEATREAYSTAYMMRKLNPISDTDDEEGQNYLIGTAYNEQKPIADWLTKNLDDDKNSLSTQANLIYSTTDESTLSYGKSDKLTVSIYVRGALPTEATISSTNIGENAVAEKLQKFGIIIDNVDGNIIAYSDGSNVQGKSGNQGYVQWILPNEDYSWHRFFVTFKLLSTAQSCKIYFRGYGYCYVGNDSKKHFQQSALILHKPKLEHSSKPTQWCEGESWSSRTGIDIESGKITLDANTVAVAKDLTIGGNARVGGMVYNEQRVIIPSDIHICKNPYDYGMITSTSLQTSSAYTTGNLLFPECGCNIKLTNNSIPEGLVTQTDTVGSTMPYTQIKKINLSLPFYHSYIINNSSVASMSNMAGLIGNMSGIPEATDSSTSADGCYKFLCGQIKNAGDICRRYLGTTVTIENSMSNEPVYVYGVKDIVSYGDIELDVSRTTGKYLYQFEPWSRSTIQWSFLARSNDNSSTYWDGSTIPSDKELYRLIEDAWFAHINKNNGAAINAAATIVTRSAVESSVQGPKIAINASQVITALMEHNQGFEYFFGTNDSVDSDSFSQIISGSITYKVPFLVPHGWFCRLKLVFENGQFFWKVEALGALAS